MSTMKKRATAFLMALICMLSLACPVYAQRITREETPNYKVAFYAFDCYHMQDENGRRYGYGYDMMENLSKYLQCTFSYVGYDKSAQDCVEMLRKGELDIYTAAKKAPEREAEFAFSTHPAITSTTCMNVKVGNTKVVAGDYSTYDGLRIGLLRRHTYNDSFLEFVKEKGFTCEIIYYETPTELSEALVNGEVDALVNSYLGMPEDEMTIENFGNTPYYIMARKEDQDLIDQLDAAMDELNIENPNWRTELYNQYYGVQEQNTELTETEQALLQDLKANNAVIRAVMNPDEKPYSWYEDGEASGILADIFKQTAQQLGLDYEIVPVSNRREYQELIESGNIDIWMDASKESVNNIAYRYKTTNAYLTTTISLLRENGSSEKIKTLVVPEANGILRSIISDIWPDATVLMAKDCDECLQEVLNGNADGAVLMSYTAQRLAQDDLQNRFRVEIVPGASLDIFMGINAHDNSHFYGIWEKTLANVSEQVSAEVVQSYVETAETSTMMAFLFRHPFYLIVLIAVVCLILFLITLYFQSVRSRERQKKISSELSVALAEAKDANEMKQNFFSKMSHDIRTPLNVVLGMTQIAQKYKGDEARLDKALDSITSEGNYLMVLLDSILDVNQLEHGHVELICGPFAIADSVKESVQMLRPLADRKEQKLLLDCEVEDDVVIGDANRFSQIMINIISNAVKYTNPGGRIEVSLTRLPDNRYRFCCADNGIGMSEEFIQHIFDDYARAEDSRISKTEGTGLGMSVVKGFTDLMGGTIRVESTLGQGSTFTVELPFEMASEEQKAAVLHPVKEAEPDKDRFKGKRALLVEDNALNAEIAITLLQAIGFTVDWAENGELGVEKFRDSALEYYYVIFMDMQMPVMDGLEATRQIRASKRRDKDLPIFAMTANTFASDREKCREAGMTGYISKPINVKDIEDTLTEYL